MFPKSTRRTFLMSSATAAAGASLAGLTTRISSAAESKSPNEQVVFGFIGAGIRFHNIIGGACQHGPAAAIADVDAVQRGRGVQSAREAHHKHDYPLSIYDYEDYRRVLDRSDIDAVVIATPDHWHTKMAIEALAAGKDVYCEKPLTLTIREGRQILEALDKYPRTFQVGTQQRTEVEGRFPTAAAIVRDGRIGKVNRVTCGIDGSLTCDPLPAVAAPKHLNWDMWLGQAPLTDYRSSGKIIEATGYGAGHPFTRTHNYFRWWYEYSGGKLTDWGAHHVDIAMWALGKSRGDVGLIKIEPKLVEHPVTFDSRGMPTQDDRFNTATQFHARVTFADGLVLDIRDRADDLGFGNGIMFEGDQGRFFVNRGKLTGKPVEELKDNPLPDDALEKLYGRRVKPWHMGDFVECIKTGATPASDVASHHYAISVCHAVNIALRLGRPLTYDPAKEDFVGDAQASSFVAREQRKGYETTV